MYALSVDNPDYRIALPVRAVTDNAALAEYGKPAVIGNKRENVSIGFCGNLLVEGYFTLKNRLGVVDNTLV